MASTCHLEVTPSDPNRNARPKTNMDRPGDYLRADDEEISGFKKRLDERLAPASNQFGESSNGDWEIADTLAQWWRPNFETFMYPFIPAHITRPKECKKLYLIQLPSSSE